MKRLGYNFFDIDKVDFRIINILVADARTSIAEIARDVGLSAPSVSERIKRLEETNVIEGYSAQINVSALGLPLAVYLRIRPLPGKLQEVADIIRAVEQIVECDRVTGEDCFIARAHVGSVQELETLIDKIIPNAMTNTSIIQSSPVSRRLPRIPAMGMST